MSKGNEYRVSEKTAMLLEVLNHLDVNQGMMQNAVQKMFEEKDRGDFTEDAMKDYETAFVALRATIVDKVKESVGSYCGVEAPASGLLVEI